MDRGPLFFQWFSLYLLVQLCSIFTANFGGTVGTGLVLELYHQKVSTTAGGCIRGVSAALVLAISKQQKKS